MTEAHALLITAGIALALLVVLRWIFMPRRERRDPPPRAPRTGGAWDDAARRRRDLAT